ncbi:MAG: DUF5106 domain-containing protein [Bacteroidales bacterium]|nr:DUF5106 domain-containing protein [Bacteroidales bacterium]
MRIRTLIACAISLALAACTAKGPGPQHYWDGYDFGSQKGLANFDAAQQRFGNWMELLEKTDTATAAACIREFLDSAKADTVSYYVYSDLFMSALYPLDSPYRNVELLRVYLRKAIADSIALDYLRFDEAELLRKSYLNLPGGPAEDGAVVLADGTTVSVLEYAARAPKTLLMLVGNAGCTSCASKMKQVEKEVSGRMQLLAVVEKSTRGEARWLRSELEGSRWTVAVAGESFLENYDFTLAPVSYIIDRKGKVKSLKQ